MNQNQASSALSNPTVGFGVPARCPVAVFLGGI
jgi:hypothetical protein